MRVLQPSPHLVAALATLTAVIATGVAGFLLQQNLELRRFSSEPPAAVKVPLKPPASASASAVKPAPPALTSPPLWKTYRNEQYGIEFKYPSNFSLDIGRYGIRQPEYQKQFGLPYVYIGGGCLSLPPPLADFAVVANKASVSDFFQYFINISVHVLINNPTYLIYPYTEPKSAADFEQYDLDKFKADFIAGVMKPSEGVGEYTQISGFKAFNILPQMGGGPCASTYFETYLLFTPTEYITIDFSEFSESFSPPGAGKVQGGEKYNAAFFNRILSTIRVTK